MGTQVRDNLSIQVKNLEKDNIKMDTEIKLFYCYSKRLKGFIESNGISYLSKGLHAKSKRPFYLYEVTENLDKILKRWDKYKEEHEMIK
jgi:hypothetical protein